MFFKRLLKKNRIYLDHASSTPVDRKMIRSFPSIAKSPLWANPSALHKEGVALKRVLENARTCAAKAIGAGTDEIIFTSNASESDNLALIGLINSFLEKGLKGSEIMVYTSPFEHAAVTETLSHLKKEIRIFSLPYEDGIDIKSIIVPETTKAVIVSVMFVQNEIGMVQPIKEVAKHIRKLRKEYPDVTILFHTDATQAPLFYDLNVLRLGVDLMTLGATKLYCSKGVGMLYKKRGVSLVPIMYGGGQEMGLRPGTEPVELIHTFAHALSYAQSHRERAGQKITLLQNYFESKVKEMVPFIRITSAGERAPHISHIVIPRIDSELLVLELDARGVAVSSKSACKNEEDGESELLSLVYPNEKVGAIRISYGRTTTKQDLRKAIMALQSVLKKYNTML